MEIYFIRHGETDRNLNKMVNPGDVNSLLNLKGLKQANDLGDELKSNGIYFDFIISSPLLRSRKTAEIISDKIGYDGDILFDDNLKEKFAGVLKDYYKEDLKKEFGTLIIDDFLKSNPDKFFEGFEKIEDFKKRVDLFFDSLNKNSLFKNKKLLIVSHGGVGRLLFNNESLSNCKLKKYK